ncbi:uncharacterized protein si:dkey-19b23.7 [Platichthys flesus]|uniref:uncharacterized protein si:dkey-19b23.7 n=1 Tax=Platichthys flesus TaxID=8260 RepID=UPI002DBD6EDD|nr:uncharacterized protein si:dkey-19b23.7 [Platichthys flesus]
MKMSSSSSKREREQKRKLQHFLGDLALLGSLQGFKYFQPWLRGKEELLLTVVNEDLGWRSPGFAVSRASSFSSSSGSSSSSEASPSSSSPSLGSRSSSPLPGEAPAPRGRPSETHTETQPRSARAPTSEDHLLPASPSEREIAVPEVNCTLFLLAGYVKYGRPYAWIRSNHERLVNIGGTDSMVRDTPMKLKSIADWQTRVIRVWDIVSELVCLCTVPSPLNPFALDMRYIQSLPLPDRFLVTGALLNFLETYVVFGNQDELHYDKVVEEVKPLRRLHVQSLLELQRHREASRLMAEDSCGEE